MERREAAALVVYRVGGEANLRLRFSEKRCRVADLAVFQGEPAEDVSSSHPQIALRSFLPTLEEYRVWGAARVWFVDPISRKLYVYTAGLSEPSAFRLPEYGVELAAFEIFR